MKNTYFISYFFFNKLTLQRAFGQIFVKSCGNKLERTLFSTDNSQLNIFDVMLKS